MCRRVTRKLEWPRKLYQAKCTGFLEFVMLYVLLLEIVLLTLPRKLSDDSPGLTPTSRSIDDLHHHLLAACQVKG